MNQMFWISTVLTVFFEPTDRRKSVKPFYGKHKITYISPNINELRAIAQFLEPNKKIIENNALDEIIKLSKMILKYVNVVITTRGSQGVVTVKCKKNGAVTTKTEEIEVESYSTEVINQVENVSGAGDCFASGFIYGVLLDLEESQCVSNGFKAAKLALLSKATVPQRFNI